MPTKISVSASLAEQITAARALSDALTHDIDLIIEVDSIEIQPLKQKLSEHNPHFTSTALQFYYVKDLKDGVTGAQLVQESAVKVLIETLATGTVGLPAVAGPRYRVNLGDDLWIETLHPGILWLTKLKRWYTLRESDRPRTVIKRGTDESDMKFLLQWLAGHDMKIEFGEYLGRTKEELYKFVHAFLDKFPDLKDSLRRAMKQEDWHSLCPLT